MPDLRGDERRLIEALRRVDAHVSAERSLVPSLLRVANLLAVQPELPQDTVLISAKEVVAVFFELDNCSARTAQRILRLLVEAVEALAEEREHLGYSRE